MRLATTGVMVMVLVLGVLSAATDENDAALERVLAGVQETYQGVTAIRCSFEQTNHYLGGESLIQRGTLEIARPAKMRWDYTEPSVRQFISDGDSLWVYHPDEGRAFVMTNLDSAAQARLFGFVLGLEDVRSEFDVVMVPVPAADGGDARIRLELTPKEPMAGVDKVWVDIRDHTITAVTIDDGMGNRTETTLVDCETNPTLDEGRFTFVAPDGVEVLPY